MTTTNLITKRLTVRWASLALICAMLLAPGLTTPAARADSPPPSLSLPLMLMPDGAGWQAVQDEATAEARSADPNAHPPIQGGTPSYRSTQLESVVFEGDFTPDINHTKLAILSDDGADVYIDGSEVLARKGQGQALEDQMYS